ncbi:MAG TPA: molybdate ABC transporter substrate-binding protein [Alphaproteobacteria bacterium]
MWRPIFGAMAAAMAFAPISPALAEEPIRLYAAGSLRGALTEVTDAFALEHGVPVAATFGASGLLRQRIENGEPGELFASADTGHPEALVRAGKAEPMAVFAHNRLCALAAAGVDVTPTTLLDRILDPAVKLGTSTPKADPSGDYAWALFEKAETLRPGSYAILDAKALKLTGGPSSPTPPPGRSLYGLLLQDRRADIFLAYCTSAREAQQEVPSLRIVDIPEPLAVAAAYGMVVIKGARPEAARLAAYILSPDGQRILALHGFTPAGSPAPSR